ncbi:MAG TPA: GAF domain-containing protein [Bryobacteraceae bacterium]|nr:GAF domain-containing protein [Bryobacteraceae bacterium]
MAVSYEPPGAAPPPSETQPGQTPIQQMELLLQIARQVAAKETLDELLQYVIEVSIHETGSERGTLFLNDDKTGELYSRIAQGGEIREIRMLNTVGIAGLVFTTGKGVVVNDPYNDPRFNQSIDADTGFITRNLVCAPIVTAKREVIGVLQVLNKRHGEFGPDDLALLESMTAQAAMTLRSAQFMERMISARKQELKFLDLVAEVTADLDLNTMLSKVVSEAAKMLQADRGTLFLNDERKNELFSRVASGGSVGEIRMPNNVGIAGAAFTTGQAINIPHAYADLRFNPAFDRKTGYFTRSILCVPIANKAGKTIGVTQVLNKRGGPFTSEDQARLKAFTAQLAISLENAKLFDDIQNIKNYNECVLQSMTSGVLTLSEEGRIVTCNDAGLRILRTDPPTILNHFATEFFAGPNDWVLDRIATVGRTLEPSQVMDAELTAGTEKLSVNLTVLPLKTIGQKQNAAGQTGTLLVIEDVSVEKRMKSAMSRYMDPAIAEKLLSAGGEVLGGKVVSGTVLFCDIRGFTTIAESLGAHGTVSLLNEYFTIMVDCIQKQGGMLDKFIGDAIMSVFGLPLPHGDDEDRGVRAAIDMLIQLRHWNQMRHSEGKVPVEVGIGINTDTIVAGNIGSPKRMDFTVIGDGVNLASRLEGACKEYGTRILISENTCSKLRGIYSIREVDRVIVKGKTEPAAVYEVLDYHTPATFPNLRECLDCYRSGLSYYRKRDWDRALSAFREALSLNPNDRLLKIYLDRCTQMKTDPPGPDWNGVWVMKTK